MYCFLAVHISPEESVPQVPSGRMRKRDIVNYYGRRMIRKVGTIEGTPSLSSHSPSLRILAPSPPFSSSSSLLGWYGIGSSPEETKGACLQYCKEVCQTGCDNSKGTHGGVAIHIMVYIDCYRDLRFQKGSCIKNPLRHSLRRIIRRSEFTT